MSHGLRMSDVYERFCRGDKLSDPEIQHGIEHFRTMEIHLLDSGPVFRLAYLEASRVCRTLEDYRASRMANLKWTL